MNIFGYWFKELLGGDSAGGIIAGAAPVDPCVGCQACKRLIDAGRSYALCPQCSCMWLSKSFADRLRERVTK